MKWIFYFMLLVNLALLAWLVNTPQKQISEPRLVLKDIGDLKIVSDVELQVRADFQKQMAEQKKQKKAADLQKAGEIDDELPRAEYDAFVFDEEDERQPVCRLLGPFPEKQDAENIADGLAAYRLASKITKSTSVEVSGYWAILPAQATVKESNELVKKLKENGLVDVRRFVTGELENAISLGLFSTETNAKRRARSVEKLGFVAVVQPKSDEKNLFWLEYMQPPGLKLPLKGVRQNFPEVEIKPCSGIASN